MLVHLNMQNKHNTHKNTKNKARLPLVRFGVSRDLEFFYENLSPLVESGIPVVDALDSIRKGVRSRAMRKILAYIIESVGSGSPLWKTLEEARVFDSNVITLVRIGEETGKLPENLQIAALEENKRRIFSSKVRSAMMYPVFVLAVAVLISVLLAWFILPRLVTVFEGLDVDVPLITQLLIDAGVFLKAYGAYAVPLGIGGLLLVLYLVFGFSKTKFIGHSIMFVTPGVRRLIIEIELSRMGYLLGYLLEAGVPITQSLESMESASDFYFYRALYRSLRRDIADGYSIRQALARYSKTDRLVPPPLQQMIISGEESGTLAETLKRIGGMYEKKVSSTTKNLTTILEPLLLVLVWLGVVAVALAIILPIYSLVGGFNITM